MQPVNIVKNYISMKRKIIMLQKEQQKYGQLVVKRFDTKEVMGKDAADDAFSVITRLLQEKEEIYIIYAVAPS